MKTLISILLFLTFSSCVKSQLCTCGDVTFSDSVFQYSIPGYQKTGYTARSTGAFVQFVTTDRNIYVKVGGNYAGHGTLSTCEVLVDGVYNQSIPLLSNNTTEVHAVSLPEGQKIVTLMNGYQINGGSDLTLPQSGVYIQGMITDTAFQMIMPAHVTNKWLFVGNSITVGQAADHIAASDFVSMFRADGRTIQVDAWATRRLFTTTAANAKNFAAFVSDEMNGCSSNELFMFLGTNNFSLVGGQTKAAFKLTYQLFLDSMHSKRADVQIYCISPLNRTTYNTPNTQGATLNDYVDAIQELLVTRTWAKFILGRDLLSLSNLSADGVHPTQAGHQEIHDKLLIQYNLLQ